MNVSPVEVKQVLLRRSVRQGIFSIRKGENLLLCLELYKGVVSAVSYDAAINTYHSSIGRRPYSSRGELPEEVLVPGTLRDEVQSTRSAGKETS